MEQSLPEPPDAAGGFPDTLWSVVAGATDADSPRRREALARLCQHYRDPMVNWFLRSGLSRPDAEDQVQRFLERHFAGDRALPFQRRSARFRSWLLVCLRRQLIDLGRGLGPELVPLDESHLESPSEAEDSALDADVAAIVHRRALAATEADWKPKRELLWSALTRFLFQEPVDGEYARVGQKLGLRAGQVKRAVFDLRNDYSVAFHGEVRQICLPHDDEGEMRHLLALVPRS